MKKLFKSGLKGIFLALAVMLAAILTCCVIMLVSEFRSGLYRQATDMASHLSEEWSGLLDSQIAEFVKQAKNVADGLPKDEGKLESYFYERGENFSNEVKSVRIFSGGLEFESNAPNHLPESAIPEGEENSLVLKIAGEGELAVTSVYTGSDENVRGFSVYVPVKNNPAVDGISVFFGLGELENRIGKAYSEKEDVAVPKGVYICDREGIVFMSVAENGFSAIDDESNLFDRIRNLSDRSVAEEIRLGMSDGVSKEISIDNTKHVLTVLPSSYNGDNFYAVSVYDSASVYPEGHSLANSVAAVLITLMLIMAVLVTNILVTRARMSKTMNDVEYTDSEYGCPNMRKFTKDASELLEQYKGSKYAVVHITIVHYSYILETFGRGVASSAVGFVVKLLKKSVGNAECYCHMNDDCFAAMLHYSDVDELKKRLHLISGIAYNFPALRQKDFFLKLQTGVYCTEMDSTVGIQKMIDRAALAAQNKSANQSDNISIYDQEIHEKFLHEAEIESKMENSLKNGEFKVFYQPKYNIGKNKPDGAEALVRWFDPENNRFRTPMEFLPIFEANGFIAEVDKYVFIEVCKFVAESISRGIRIIPVSVNVSRVTAMQKGFAEFYIETKQKYGIPHKLITIEFTESFADENYEMMASVVERFHQNGFLCSIDDFGAGYSSYNILKELQMDELKLDRFFISSGVSKERDDKLLSSIISLAKNLNMKVVQEGVENVDDLKRLISFGCDVVQGYIYSRPIPATDFIAFIREGGQMSII